MTEVADDLARAERAFTQPALTLLGRKHAAVVVTVFGQAFGYDRAAMPADRLHTLVDVLMGQLRAAGSDHVDEPGRALCRRWVGEQWLMLSAGEDGQEEYSLTSGAREAIDYVARLAGNRAVFGQSRIRAIIDAARHCAMDADPDVQTKVARLDEQIAALRARRDELVGGVAEPVPAQRVVEQYLNVREMTASLPADFLRLSEYVKDFHRALVDEFRQEGNRTGEVLDTYLARSAALMTESLEGRAFGGAVELLRDESLMSQLRRDLETIAAHPFAKDQPAAEIADFRNTVSAIRSGITAVLEARRRLSASLRTYITSHDALRDRELDDVLREAKKELAAWMASSGPRARVPLDLTVSGLDIGNTRQRFYAPADHAPPPPLHDLGHDVEDPPSLAALRQRGGPSVGALRAAVAGARGDRVSAGAVFNTLPEPLRRPVEVLGLLQLAAGLGAFDDAGAESGVEVVEAVRVDGTRRALTVPVVRLGARVRGQLAVTGAAGVDRDD